MVGMTTIPHDRTWTRDDLAALPEDGNRYEILDGALLVTPAPSYSHQAVSYTHLDVYKRQMLDMVAAGGQVLVATHSPVVAAVPGARLVQVDEEGLRDVAWEDLDLVFHHRSFLQDPRRYLRHRDG